MDLVFPDTLAIICPRCAGQARFRAARLGRVARRMDLRAVRRARDVSLLPPQPDRGITDHRALHWSGLDRETGPPRDLDEGQGPARWQPMDAGIGVASCAACGLRRKHRLDWPRDAWFAIEHRGQVLWALDREMAEELRSFVASADRRRSGLRYQRFLERVPSVFLGAKVREAVVNKLTARLDA